MTLPPRRNTSIAAQNQRLPLRVIVQVLFFEQLRLRTSIAGCFFVSDNLDNNSRNLDKANPSHIIDYSSQFGSALEPIIVVDDMKELKSLSMDQRKLKPPSKATAIAAEPPHTLPLDLKLMDSDKCLESEFTKLLDYEAVDKGLWNTLSLFTTVKHRREATF